MAKRKSKYPEKIYIKADEYGVTNYVGDAEAAKDFELGEELAEYTISRTGAFKAEITFEEP